MKASVLLNVLNHVPPDAEWDVADPDVLTLPDGRRISISLSADTMTPGQSRLVDVPPAEAL